MRDYEFRGKSKQSGEWQFGFLTGIDANSASIGGVNNVIPATVGQYTGLEDKNGVKIFEGDIVRVESEYHKKPFTGFVEYIYCAFVIQIPNSFDYHEFLDAHKNTTVIGNVHDNPEFLEGTAE